MKRVFYLILIFTVACTNRQATVSVEKAQDSIIPPKVTVLADLPDSLQPRVVMLDTMPKPEKYIMPRKGTIRYGNRVLTPPEKHPLPVLKDRKGDVVKNKEGQPYLLGTGGIGHFKTLTTDDGLTMDGASASLTDSHGNLWFGSAGGGISRNDGIRVTNYTTENGLANNIAVSIAEDRNGNIWIGGDESMVSCFDGRSFTNFSLTETKTNYRVNCITQDSDGKMWFGTTPAGVFIYYGDTIINRKGSNLFVNDIREILEDQKKNIWIATAGGGLHRFDGNAYKTFTNKDGLPSNGIFALEEDDDGNIWIGTSNGISMYDGFSFTNFTITDGIPDRRISDIKKDSKGNLWFGTSQGVCKYDGAGFTTFTKSEGLPGIIVNTITEDKTGNIWFGTLTAGVSCYYGDAFTYFNDVYGIPDNHIYCIAEDSAGNIWFGSSGSGLSVFDGRSFTILNTSQGLSGGFNHSIFKDRSGKIWIGPDAYAINLYDGYSFTRYNNQQGFPFDIKFYVTQDNDKKIWMATALNGVICFDGKSVTNYTNKQGLAGNDIRCILQDDEGNLWFSSSGHGLSCFDGKSFTTYNKEHGLPHDILWASAKDKEGNLWFGSSNGIAFLSAEKVKTIHDDIKVTGSFFKSFNKADGLPDNYVLQVQVLDDGKIAVGTNKGIAVFNISEDHSRLTNIEIYNTSTGYPIKDINGRQNCLLKDSKGVLWGGTGSGEQLIVRLDRSKIRRDSTPPTVVIRELKINNNPVCWSYLVPTRNTDSNSMPAYITEEVIKYGRKMTGTERDSVKNKYKSLKFDSLSKYNYIPQKLVLPYKFNEVTIDYGAIETGRPFMVNFQHFLEGYDREWSSATSNTSATFGNISAGTYTFKVKAQSPDGIWSEPIAYSFKVLPPWWATWWFRTLSLLLIASILYAIYRWRMNQVLKVERTRNSIAQDLHDEVGSTLSSVSLYVAVAQKGKETLPPKTATLLDKISKSTIKMMEGMNDIVWATKADNDTFEQVTNRMRAFAVNVTEAKGVSLKFDVEKGLERVKVDMKQRKNIYMLFKEVVNNAIKHSECKNLSVTLNLTGKKLDISIIDDGKGFDMGLVNNNIDNMGRNGIKGMKERASSIGAKLEIDSVVGQGTKVSLSLYL
ncbi:MAG: hypothetical protein KDC11_11460 [Chitinophagaceae bacterium]|nr:hypothetical protein [Chitinophagaceae bacterium]